MIERTHSFVANPGAQAEFLRCEDRYPALFMGQGGGKSWGGSTFIVLDHCNFPETDSLCIAPTFPLLREITLPVLLERFKECGITAIPHFGDMVIRTPQLGSKILLRSGLRAERITGFEVGRTWIDEPARIPEFKEPHRSVWFNAVARTRHPGVPHDRLRVAITGTHEGKGTWVYRDWEKEPRPGTKVFRGSTRENPTSTEYADLLVKMYGRDLAHQYVEGFAVSDSSAAIPYEILEFAQSSSTRRSKSLDALNGEFFWGIDVGRSKSLTVAWGACYEGDQLLTQAVIELRGAPFKDQYELVRSICAMEGTRRVCIDATYNPQTAEDAESEFGERVEGVVFSNKSKLEMVQRMRIAMEEDFFKIPAGDQAEDILADFYSVKRVVSAAGVVQYTAPFTSDGHSDRFWAAALAVKAYGDGPTDFDFHTGGRLRSASLRGAW